MFLGESLLLTLILQERPLACAESIDELSYIGRACACCDSNRYVRTSVRLSGPNLQQARSLHFKEAPLLPLA